MTQKAEILLEGTYLYFQNDVNYSQENFKLVQLLDLPQLHVYSEILSRIETGEFLKIVVRYEMTNHYTPFFVRIEKSIGNKYVQESFRVDLHSNELLYTFQGPKMTQEFKRPHSSKHYLTSPSFATAAMFTLTKKMDPTGRTAVTLVNSPNNWTYEAPPTDRIVFTEFKSRELDDYKLNNTSLSASHLCMYEHDSSSAVAETPADLFISKHFAIPYQLKQGDLRIDIKQLKKHT